MCVEIAELVICVSAVTAPTYVSMVWRWRQDLLVQYRSNSTVKTELMYSSMNCGDSFLRLLVTRLVQQDITTFKHDSVSY